MSLTAQQNVVIDESLYVFQSAMNDAGLIAWQRIEEYLNTLEIDSNKHVAQTPYNNDVGNEIGVSVLHGVQSSDYAQGIEQMKSAVDEIADLTRQYYAEQDVYLQTTSYNYDRMLKGLQTTIKNEIDQAFSIEAVNQKISNPAINAYFQHHVNQDSTKEATIKDMQHRIEDRFYNFSITSSLTIMQQYARRVNEIFAIHGTNDLIWVAYQGANDELTREFCEYHLAGTESAIYHIDEVRQWANEPPFNGVWDGMIPNTDQNSIFVNAGGFNCRHSFVYMTQRQVQKEDPTAITRAEAKGLSIYYRGEN